MMEFLQDPVLLSRLQFAVTAIFHILWPVLTVGLAVFLLILEVLWIRTGDNDYYRHARFWSKLFLLNFTIGVISGLPLEFEFGTNWSEFARTSGDFFGNILGFEGAMAFMLEAGFLGIMLLGWERVSRGIHLFATSMVVLGSSLSVLWIMVANSWMQHPVGGEFSQGHFVIQSYSDAIFNPILFSSTGHMWLACLETSMLVIAGISSWYIYKNRDTEFFLKSFKLAIVIALIIAPLQIWLGDQSGRAVFQYQPAKGAAIEGHWTTNAPGDGADWAVFAWPDKNLQRNHWQITLPNLLSVLATHTVDGKVVGLKNFAVEDQPPALPLLFYAFRLMVAIGFWFMFLGVWSLLGWSRDWLHSTNISHHPWFLRAWLFSIPLGYIAVECGWIVREIGRQPWIIYGVMRTTEGASQLPATVVASSLAIYLALYLFALLAFLVFARRWIQTGPATATGISS